MIHKFTITLEIESACDSTLALEEAVASCLVNQEHDFQADEQPGIEFRISRVEWREGSIDGGRSTEFA